jgi:regulator of cell morphogenesis and NO signaling
MILISQKHDKNQPHHFSIRISLSVKQIKSRVGNMAFGVKKIDKQAFVQDIVADDYRSAKVFLQYGIPFYCAVKLPLELACQNSGADLLEVEKDLEQAMRTISISSQLPFNQWTIPFLADYITHVHHAYLKIALPQTLESLGKFATEQGAKFSYLPELLSTFQKLATEMLPHIAQEEDIIFPYIRQIAHAYHSQETYASLLVRTLSKPVEEMMKHEDEMIVKGLRKLRLLTNNYTPPANACGNHKVNFSLLEEIDNDLVQHLYLENSILFPKAIKMEKDLLQKN